MRRIGSILVFEAPDEVTGIALHVESFTGEVEGQGDIFDRGWYRP